MKKRDLKKLALMGLTSGMLVATQAAVHAEDQENPTVAVSETQLLSQLSTEGQELYQNLDEEGQLLARLVVGRGCGCSQENQGKLYKGGAHGCGKSSCGGSIADNYDSGYYGSEGGHSCGGGYSGGGYGGGHGCSGGSYSDGGYMGGGYMGGGYMGGNGQHGCSGGSYSDGGYMGGGYMSGNGQHGCSGSAPVMPPQGMQSYNPQPGQPGQPVQPGQPGQSMDSNKNRSMPQWENQPQYRNQNPAGKESSYNTTSSNRYVAEDQVMDQRPVATKLTEAELKAKLNADTKKIFEGLSPEGKRMALKLAEGKSDLDANQAVKTAAMKEKRNGASKN